MHEPIDREIERIASEVIGAAIRVHTALGPGLLESIYEVCLCHELTRRGLRFERQVPFPVVYEGMRLETGLRLDLLVEGRVVVELKAVEKLLPIHDAQVLTYLKLSGMRLGLLMNFNVVRLKEGLRRLVQLTPIGRGAFLKHKEHQGHEEFAPRDHFWGLPPLCSSCSLCFYPSAAVSAARNARA